MMACAREANTNMELVSSMREQMKNIKLIPPKVVTNGPIFENVHKGKDIDLFEFPVPKWHKHDAGRYIGTFNCVVTRDPQEGWVNIGTYRSMISDKDTLLNFMDLDSMVTFTGISILLGGSRCPLFLFTVVILYYPWWAGRKFPMV